MNHESVTDKPAKQSEKSLYWNLIQMVTLLGIVGLVFVMLLLYQIGRTHDDHAAATSLRLYDGLVSLKMGQLGDHIRVFTYWDEAVEQLATAYDEAWWERNVGVYAIHAFNLSFNLAVDGQNNPRLLATADGTRNEPSAEILTPSLRTLLAQARNKPVSQASREAVATGMVWFEGAPHLAAAVRYLPETDEVVNPDPDALLVYALPVTNYLLAVTGEIMERSLDHRAELPEGAVGTPLILADGTHQGWVTWSEPKPPLAAVGLVLPALLAVLLIIIFLAFFAQHVRKLIAQLRDAEQHAQFQLTFHRIAAETATALTTTTSDAEFDATINQCLQRLGLLFGTDRSYVSQFSDDLAYTTNDHEWCTNEISPAIDNLKNFVMDDRSWLTTRLLRDGVLYARVADLPPEAAAVKAELQRLKIQSFLHATTHGARGKLAGFIGFDSVRKERSWRDDELDMIQTIAGVLGSASLRAQAEKSLQASHNELQTKNNILDSLSKTDQLTGIANRRRVQQVIEQEIDRFNRYKKPFCIFLLDVDHFKAVNDNHGHEVGDQVLVELVGLVRSEIRRTDTFGRWGGEEFVLVCPETSLHTAQTIAEKIRTTVREYEFTQGLDITLSIGVSEFQSGATLQETLVEVDQKMYLAKQKGRDRVES